jgi:hypothetical protein
MVHNVDKHLLVKDDINFRSNRPKTRGFWGTGEPSQHGRIGRALSGLLYCGK